MVRSQKFLRVIEVDIHDGDMIENTRIIDYEQLMKDLKFIMRLDGLS